MGSRGIAVFYNDIYVGEYKDKREVSALFGLKESQIDYLLSTGKTSKQGLGLEYLERR